MFDRAIANFRPRPRVRTLAWCRQNIQTNEGRPYDHDAYPHSGAPGGPFDAFDCPKYRTVICQFGSQLAKTFQGICCMLKTADCDPCTMMFTSSDQKLATEEVRVKIYPMLERCPTLRDQMRPKMRQKQDFVELDDCRIFVGWARSVSTLASKAVRVGMGNEIDKWEHQSTSSEADPLELFMDRFKSFPSHKIIFESTPAQRQSSRIERLRLASTNCSYWVPCPVCGRYQTLKMAQLKWDKTDGGKHDKDLARTTAHYVCEHCEAELHDQHRGPMMRSGVWIPEGCGADDEKARYSADLYRSMAVDLEASQCPPFSGFSGTPWIVGTPARDGRDAGYQLSSLYALSLGWGDIAAKFADTHKKPENLRNFINQWLAETWEVRGEAMSWEKLADRLIIKVPRYIVPTGFTLLTCGADIQADRIVYVVEAWANGRRSHTVDYGELDTLDDLFDRVLTRSYLSEDKKQQFYISLTLVDSGFHPRDVYTFCKKCAERGRKVWPCKGSSEALHAPYRESRLGENTLAPGAPIIHVDTLTTQDWITHQLRLSYLESDGAASLFDDAAGMHQDFLEQLTNEACITKLVGTTNVSKEVWERIDASLPNDYRDCRRYAFAAMLRLTKGAEIRERTTARIARPRGTEKKGVQFLERPGGWVPRK